MRIGGPEVLLEPNAAQALAVTLHELATNAAKYGSLSVPNGQIDLSWSHQDDRLNLRWTEMGGPPVQAPTHRGFGGRIIEQMIGQLKGETRFDWRPQSLICQTTLACNKTALDQPGRGPSAARPSSLEALSEAINSDARRRAAFHSSKT